MRETVPETSKGQRRISRSEAIWYAAIVAGLIGFMVYISHDPPLRFLTQLAFFYGTFFFGFLVPMKLSSGLGGRYPRMQHSYSLRLLVGGPFFAVPLAVYTLTALVLPELRDDHGIGTMFVTIVGGVGVTVTLMGALILTGQAGWWTVRRHANMDRNVSNG